MPMFYHDSEMDPGFLISFGICITIQLPSFQSLPAAEAAVQNQASDKPSTLHIAFWLFTHSGWF